MPEHLVRRLGPDDAAAFSAIRRAGLEESPTSFGSSPSEDFTNDDALTRERLDQSGQDAIIGAFSDAELVGVVGLHRETHSKARHHASIWGMYVWPEHRRGGHGRALLMAVIAHARGLPDLVWLKLGVSQQNQAARALYQGLGFETWGLERDALRVDDVSVDEEHMALRLDGAGE